MPDDDLRDSLLRAMWEPIRAWSVVNVGNVPSAQRAIDAGADPQDVVLAMQAAAYEAVFGVVSLLDDGAPDDADFGTLGWLLVEAIEHEDGTCEMNGEAITGLHESLLMADPTGREGSDFFS
jgi:hypothetical protein